MNKYIINSLSNNTFKFIQISDTHLINSTEKDFLGINPFKSYLEIIQAIQRDEFQPQFIVVTGDIAQENTQFVYQLFSDNVKKLNIPVFWIPGNHDFMDTLNDVLVAADNNIRPDKHLFLGEQWQIILLNSKFNDEVYGLLCEDQLSFLENKLSANPNLYSIIGLHHHIFPVGNAWLDQHNLKNSAKFLQIIDKYKKIKFIFHGHTHQESELNYNNYKIFGVPATSVQFKPNTPKFMLDIIQPGWREFTLMPNGSFISQVKRLQGNVYIPDITSKGY